jgi:hypothetical protein
MVKISMSSSEKACFSQIDSTFKIVLSFTCFVSNKYSIQLIEFHSLTPFSSKTIPNKTLIYKLP